MQDVCIDLEVADPTSLPAAISKLLRVVATLPRLERFVGDVCEVTAHVPQLEALSNADPACRPSLCCWM